MPLAVEGGGGGFCLFRKRARALQIGARPAEKRCCRQWDRESYNACIGGQFFGPPGLPRHGHHHQQAAGITTGGHVCVFHWRRRRPRRGRRRCQTTTPPRRPRMCPSAGSLWSNLLCPLIATLTTVVPLPLPLLPPKSIGIYLPEVGRMLLRSSIPSIDA